MKALGDPWFIATKKTASRDACGLLGKGPHHRAWTSSRQLSQLSLIRFWCSDPLTRNEIGAPGQTSIYNNTYISILAQICALLIVNIRSWDHHSGQALSFTGNPSRLEVRIPKVVQQSLLQTLSCKWLIQGIEKKSVPTGLMLDGFFSYSLQSVINLFTLIPNNCHSPESTSGWRSSPVNHPQIVYSIWPSNKLIKNWLMGVG